MCHYQLLTCSGRWFRDRAPRPLVTLSSLSPGQGPEVLQVVLPLLLVSPRRVEQGDGLIRRHVQLLYHVAAHHVTRPVTSHHTLQILSLSH